MNSVRQKQPLFVGYFHNLAEADRLATVTHPLQAWYSTQTVDFYNNKVVDNGRCGLGDTMTQDDIDRGMVIAIVGFAPLKPAEFVIVRIQQKVGQS